MKIGPSQFRIWNVVLLISTLSVLILNTACARKDAPATLSVQFSSQNSTLSAQINHIFLNISGPNYPLQVFDRECREGQTCNDIQVETTSGSDLLIQVLVVTEDETGTNTVYYDDITVALKSGDNAFRIGRNSAGSSTWDVYSFTNEGRVAGRYVPSAGHKLSGKYLTGDIEMSIYTRPGKPSMKLMKQEIFGGWFNVFALDNLPFLYRFSGFDQNGVAYKNEPVFNDLHDGQGLDLSSAGIAPSSTVAHYYSSLPYLDERDGVYQQRNFEAKILGYFGAASGSLCTEYLDSSTPLDGSNGTKEICKTATGNTCTSFFTWGDIGVQPASLNGSVDSCAGLGTATEIEIQNIGEGGHSYLMGNFGPFIENESLGVETIITMNSTSSLSWVIASQVYLPAGVEVFINPTGMKPDGSSFNKDDVRGRNDGVLCGELSKNGFQSFGVVKSNPGTKATFNVPANVSSAVASGNARFAFCPRRSSGGYYETAVVDDRGGQGEAQGDPTKIHLAKVPTIDGNKAYIGYDVCTPFVVELRNDSGYQVQVESSISITLNDGGAGTNIQFYNSFNDCYGNSAPSGGFNSKGKNFIWVRYFPATGTSNYTLTASDFAGNLQPGSFSSRGQAPGAVASIRLISSFDRAPQLEVAETENCVLFRAMAFDANGELTNFSGSESFNTQNSLFNGGAMNSFYNNFDCSAGGSPIGSPVTPTAGVSKYDLYLEAAAFGGPGTLSNVFTSCGLCQSTSVAVVTPGTYNHFHPDVITESAYSSGSCLQVNVGAYDDHKPNSYPVNFPDSNILGFTDYNNGNSGHIIDNVISPPSIPAPFTCDQALPGDFLGNSPDLGAVSSGSAVKTFYYKPSTSGADALNIELSYNGETRRLSSYISPESSNGGFLESLDHPVLDFGTKTVADGSVMVTANFQNTGGNVITNLALDTSGLGTGFTLNSNNGCTAGNLPAGNTCSVDIDFDNQTPANYTGYLYIDYTDNNAFSRRTIVEIKGERVP